MGAAQADGGAALEPEAVPPGVNGLDPVLRGLSSLRGVIIDRPQVGQLAEAFAAELEVTYGADCRRLPARTPLQMPEGAPA
ncbi:hypothetical protein [Microtetraspora malaysiensis]|uniref:hypothetical protein n=1 Tax=Microtetraspora malaysiensis TaxID=161358 RepID=UPI003D913119